MRDTDHRAALAGIKTFPQLVAYLRDEMGWPIANGDAFEDLTFDYSPEELGIDAKNAAKIQEIKRLRPLSPNQPWGIFFVKFEPKRLPVIALRRILNRVALKKRASANSADRKAWAADDLLFVSNYGEGEERQISFAHFSTPKDGHDLPTLKVLGWDNLDTALHLGAVSRELTEHLAWPEDDGDAAAWREQWRAAFTLRHLEVVNTSKELSIRLAALARAIRDRIKTALAIETEGGPLMKLMKAFQEALVHDLNADGFADMYAQTIAYGLLSARIADPHKKTVDDFAAHMRTNPFLRELMETFIKVGGRRGRAGGPGIDFDELGVSEVVDLLDHANMKAVVRDFGDKNPQEDPVIHFYELFLKEYDAKKRMQRGVFYTPRPVVSYIVRSVDELLRTEFGLEDGLADTTSWGEMAKRHRGLKVPEGTPAAQTFVQILDPATGTGTFLVEVIDVIHQTMDAKWKAQGHGEKKIAVLWNEYVPKHLLPRLHAYELLMAPYAIAHLKIGLKLYESGYRFASDERARIYLTNALEPASDSKKQRGFEEWLPALAHEAQSVDEIKRKQRFTVVIGNPPYSNFGQLNKNQFILDLLEDYKRGLDEKKLNLDDDFIKFFRLAHWLLQSSHCGVIGLITNHTFLGGTIHRRLREALCSDFQLQCFADLHGNSRTGEVCPDGSADENVFDIQQGVAISLLVSPGRSATPPKVLHTDVWGLRGKKYEWASRQSFAASNWKSLAPEEPDFLLCPSNRIAGSDYDGGLPVPEILTLACSGIETQRDDFVMHFCPQDAWNLVECLAQMSPESARRKFALGPDGRDWKLALAINDLRESGPVRNAITPISYRPFDVRWTYYTGKTKGFLAYPRNDASQHMFGDRNIALIMKRSRLLKADQFSHIFVTKHAMDKNFLGDQSYFLPLYTKPSVGTLFAQGQSMPLTNLSPKALALVPKAMEDASPPQPLAAEVFDYMYAVLNSPGYRSRFLDYLKRNYARVPFTANSELFRALARLGGQLVALHLLESEQLNRPITEFVGGRDPEIEKLSWSKNTVWVDKAKTVGFSSVPEDVWNFHIGGYQVCEKWLKDRKGRTLSNDDITHYQKIVVALNETIRLMKEIDEVIEAHGGWPRAFQTGEAQAAAPKVIPFQPRIVQPDPKRRYVTCVPLVPLKIAAGAFSDPQYIDDAGFEWVAVETKRRLHLGMFVAQVVGKSMEPAILDGAYCLFAAPVEGTRLGKTVLVQMRDTVDPETGERYTVKRYESEKAEEEGLWRHTTITLKPLNPTFEPIVLTGSDEGLVRVVAEVIEVLGAPAVD